MRINKYFGTAIMMVSLNYCGTTSESLAGPGTLEDADTKSLARESFGKAIDQYKSDGNISSFEDQLKSATAAGVDVNTRSPDGNLALTVATYQKHANIVEFLLQSKADPNAKTKGHDTALCVIAEESVTPVTMKIFNSLIEHGADVNIGCSQSWTPLHLSSGSSRGCKASFAKSLIDKGAYVDSLDDLGGTPLHMAALFDCLPAVKILIANKASMNTRIREGGTALSTAMFMKNWAIVKYLKSKGAKQ